ncbi:hypothetical protein [Dehalobacter restrictus]|uniref:Uncharacterized protein n=1 Tax=Dehalobacter restrictus TaxID=55583 RepID=A0A857DM48_9FIRM|nr:hypothetical protein [Dehalobacter restrictus]QHA01455.1 hypothetical protein GQ588_12795 [Dehalobacter restrictus]
MPFLFKGDFRVNSTIINGVQYVTFSFFDGDKLLFDKVGDLIEQSFKAIQADKIPNENILANSIAIGTD